MAGEGLDTRMEAMGRDLSLIQAQQGYIRQQLDTQGRVLDRVVEVLERLARIESHIEGEGGRVARLVARMDKIEENLDELVRTATTNRAGIGQHERLMNMGLGAMISAVVAAVAAVIQRGAGS